jgi:hypothetical protein
MRQFSLREVFLVTGVMGIAMAVNVWNHRDLRDRLAASERHAEELRHQADRLHSALEHAKLDHESHQRDVLRWARSGELQVKQDNFGFCGSIPGDPDWDVLKDYTPSKRR